MGLLLTGITYEEARRKWLARAGTGEDRYHVGRYETEEEAAAALRAEQERRQRAELEDPIDHMCKLATSPGASYSSAIGVYFDVRSNGPAVTLTALPRCERSRSRSGGGGLSSKIPSITCASSRRHRAPPMRAIGQHDGLCRGRRQRDCFEDFDGQWCVSHAAFAPWLCEAR